MIGAVTGIGSSMATTMYDLVTDDHALKFISSLGIYLGILIALLTLILKMAEVRERMKSTHKKP
jgi:hypothetical protein